MRQEKKRAILRRYNSHESSSSFEVIKMEHHRSPDSQDNTPDSTKSRVGSMGGGSTTDTSSGERRLGRVQQEYNARDFLERYSLPRVIQVDSGEPLLLYRCFDSFTKVQAKALYYKRGKEKVDENVLHFPEGYTGWFSLINEKGDKNAVLHHSILALVREQVCSFLSVQPFSAYAAQNSDIEDTKGKLQYVKTQVRGGQLFQLRAVFQHKERSEGSTRHFSKSSKLNKLARDKDLANRYAQLVGQNNQEIYVPLTTKGEFFEIHSSMKARICFPGMLDKTGPLALDKDCLYKISHLLRRVSLPIKVKLLHGSLPVGIPKDFPDTFILEKKYQEPLLVTCTLPPPWSETRHQISCFNLNSKIKLSKCTLGFDSENRLFKSQRLQAALAFCHKNVETWYREVRLVPNLEREIQNKTDSLCSNCKNMNINCNIECKGEKMDKNVNVKFGDNKQLITKEVLEKFPKPKRWYQRILNSTKNEDKFEEIRDPMEGMEKRKSIDRYKDMSKLIEEKFGRKGYNPVKKSASFMFQKRIEMGENSEKPALLKCQSLDTQLYSVAEEHNTSKSNISDNLSYDFRLCILENDEPKVKSLNDVRPQENKIVTKVDVEKRPDEGKLKKTKPDLIPTLPKDENVEQPYITERLCNEFHVKTKVQKKVSDQFFSGKIHTNLSIFDPKKSNVKSVVMHREGLSKRSIINFLNIDEIPYSHVKDEVSHNPQGRQKTETENIYAEICDEKREMCNKCDSKVCECIRTSTRTDYCYVKLGSNGDSVTQSDSDEAIYNTLR